MTEGVNEPDEAREVTPFMVINRGEDSVTTDDRVVFADFSPRVVPADTPDEVVELAPKGSSVREPAFLKEDSPPLTELEMSEKDAPPDESTAKDKSTAAGKEDGLASPTGS